jgi:TFIIF-interacting CTD phosphatase-like protein
VTNEKGLREFINDRRGKKVKTILVEQQEQRKTLVLDLDETLVHSSYELEKWDFKTNVRRWFMQFEQNGQERTAYTKVRYGLDRFLETMSQHY